MKCKLIEYYADDSGKYVPAIEFPNREAFLLVGRTGCDFTTQQPYQSILLAGFEISLEEWSRIRFYLDTKTATKQALAQAVERAKELRRMVEMNESIPF